MSEEKKEKAGGSKSLAERYVDEELVKARKSLNTTRIVMVGLALFVLGYMSILTSKLGKYTDPEEAAATALDLAQPHVATQTENLLSQIETKIPELMRDLPDQALENLPEYRKDMQEKIVVALRDYANDTAADLVEHLEGILDAHGDSILELLETADNRESAQALAIEITEEIKKVINDRSNGYESIQDKLDLSLLALRGIDNHVAYLAQGEGLNDQEEKQRRVIAILMATVNRELDKTAASFGPWEF